MKRYLLTLFVFLLAGGIMAQPDVYKPTLKSPANASDNQVPNVTISWNAIAGSTGLRYQVQMDTTISFTSTQKVDTTMVLFTGYGTHELLFGQTYYWRVRAIDLGVTSAWSDIWTFKILNGVTLAKPANNSKNKQPDPYLNTKTTIPGSSSLLITGVTAFDFQLDTSPDFDSPQLWQATVAAPASPKATDTIYTRTSKLYFGAKYYWRARAHHHLSASAWSAPYNFTVALRDTLSLPVNGATGQALDAKLKWKGFTGLLAYEYELATDAGFVDIIAHSEVDTNFTYASLTSFGTKYYFRSRGRHQRDTLDWTYPFNFTTINTVVKSSPDSAGRDVSVKPKFIWKGLTAISGYQLQLDSLMSFVNPILDYKPDLADVSYQLTKKLNPSKMYYWRMRAFSSYSGVADTTDWSPVWPFTTVSSIGMEEHGDVNFSIFPNPAKDRFVIRLDLSEAVTAQLVLIDLLGKTLISRELNLSYGNNVKEILLDNVNKGIYVLRLTINGQTLNKKLIVD